MKMPKVSVIMLTYNRENFVSAMIESVLGQTMTDFEFIIIDNGSTDRSGSIAEEYAVQDDRIKVIHTERESIGCGRNRGLVEAKGDYVAFVDDDDVCEPKYLELLYSMIVESSSEVAICGTQKSVNDEKILLSPKEALKTLLDRKFYNVGFPTKLIRRELFEGRIFAEKSRYDDIYLMPKILAAANQIVYCGKPYYVVKRHDHNNSAWTTDHRLLTREILEEYVDVYEKRTKWLREIYPEDTDLWNYYKWSFYISMVQKIITLNLSGCENIYGYMRRELQENKVCFLNSGKIQDYEMKWMGEFVG